MRKTVVVLVGFSLALGACRRVSDDAAVPPTPAVTAGPTRVLADDEQRLWQGVLPCRDCLGIDTRLRLADRDGARRFTLQEIYVGAGDGKPFERTGGWIETTRRIDKADASIVVLDPEAAAIALRELPDGALELLGPDGRPSADGPSLRLQRQSF